MSFVSLIPGDTTFTILNHKVMKFNLITTAFLFLTSIGFGQEVNVGSEPKATFILQIGDQQYFLSQGEEMTLDPIDKAAKVSIRLGDSKRLETGAMAFDYPNGYGFEFEESEGYKNWTLDGNNFVIMLFQFDAKTELDDFLDLMISQFGKKNTSTSATSMTLGNRKLEGKRLDVSLVGQRISLDFLEIVQPDGKTRFLALQDTKNEDGSDSAESRDTIKMIAGSVKYD